jgi:hypothetical protein
MFKRAMKSHHWMAIGLDEWNKFEESQITASHVANLRTVERAGLGSDDEDDDELELESYASELEGDELDQTADADSGAESAPSVSGESDEEPDNGTFEFCPVCPGKKFLTDQDRSSHMLSAKHLKQVAKLERPTVAEVTTPSAKKLKVSVEPKPRKQEASANNRKARRASLASQKK